jgi:hypothetical protein
MDVEAQLASGSDEAKAYLISRHESVAQYYWSRSKTNKRNYLWSRYLTIGLGAIVTLFASLASAEFISGVMFWDRAFAIATPVLAATLTVVAGFSQNFQWGAAWREMVVTGEEIEKERDRLQATRPEDIELMAELEGLNDVVLTETRSFFGRMLGEGASSA